MTTRDYQTKSALCVFLSYFRPHWKLFLMDLCCAFLISIIDLAFPYVSRMCMERLLPERLFTHIQTLSFGFYDKNRTGHLMSRMTAELFDITELAHHGPEDLFISLVTVIGAIAIMFTIHWQLALVVMILIPIFIIVTALNRRSMMAASRGVKQTMAVINADIESSLSGMRTAKAFSNEGAEASKFNRSNEQFKTSKRNFHKAMGRFTASMEFFMCVLPLAVITVGGVYIMRGEMNYVDLITFSLYISTFINPMRKMANFNELFANGFAGLHRFIELMSIEPDLQDKPDAVDLTDVKGEITVENVSFAYERDETEVLHHVNLHVKAGETIAVVGPSGGGKSTLCNLIPRFYDVTEGCVSIDGHDVRDVTQRSLRRSVGVVQQDVFLFAASIMENIRYGRPDATVDEVIAAARRAEIYDDIMAMPDGFNTYVGERGSLLSGGQKQRISIARIFLKNPPVLILDEATSALDSVTESKIQHAFDELAQGRTTLIIAHRLSTVRAANRILVVRDGVITEEGAHEELMAKNGGYAQLYNTQNLHG